MSAEPHASQEPVPREDRERTAASVLIVGGGIAGVSTAWHLARRGVRVCLLERERLLGTHSSGLNAAILRTLTSDPVLTELAQRSAAFLREPPQGFTELPLVDPCGLVLPVDARHRAEIERWLTAADTTGSRPRAQWLDAARLAELAPHMAPLEEEAGALYLPDEGRLDVAELMAGFERGALQAGAEIVRDARVAQLVEEGGRVRGVRLADGAQRLASTVILAAGGWAGRLGAEAGSRVRLRPTRRHLLVTAPDSAVDPSWPVVWALTERPFYFRPESGGLMLCACDQVDVDPDACEPDPEVLEAIARGTRRHLPGHADAGVHSFWCGMRTLTRDGRFAIGPDPDLGGLFWVAGLGGHGMVAGPEVGRMASELLLHGPGRVPEAAPHDPGRLVATGV